MKILMSASLLGALALTTGCSSAWELQGITVITCSVDKPFYRDADGDGWGDDPNDYVEACAPGEVDGYIVRNARDCDDSDPAIGGKIGSVCPSELVLGGNEAVGIPGVEREAVAVLPTAERVTAVAAKRACEAGWGGDLLVLRDNVQWRAFKTAVDSAVSGESYAAFVDYTWDGTKWGWREPGMNPESIGYCTDVSTNTNSTSGPQQVLSEGMRMAVVRTAGGVWCLGWPGDAGGSYLSTEEPDGVHDYYGHFACERTNPSPYDYREPPVDSAAE